MRVLTPWASVRRLVQRPRSALERLSLSTVVVALVACTEHHQVTAPRSGLVAPPQDHAVGLPVDVPAKGRYIFRHWTFGDEQFWTDTLHLNEVVETAVSPATALAVGLKVDAERLPPGFLASADLTSPATTVELLRRDAVVGIGAKVTADKHISWGPGMYDAEFNRDGINSPVVLPPALGLRGVALETYTAEGPVSYWNAYVAVTQMRGHGSFSDRLWASAFSKRQIS